MPSMRLIDSTWITSAPSAASTPAAIGPAHHAVRSRTRTPASGSSSSPTVGAATRDVRARSCRCAHRGGARAAAAAGPRRPCATGRRGILNDPGRVVDEDVARDEVVAVEDVLAAVHRRHRDAQLARAGARSRRSCARASTRGRSRSTRPSPSGGPSALLHGSPSMRSGRSMSSRKLWNCCAAVGAEPDVAVERRLDRRRLDGAAGADDRRAARATRGCTPRSCSPRWSSPRRSRSRCGRRGPVRRARAARPPRPPSPENVPANHSLVRPPAWNGTPAHRAAPDEPAGLGLHDELAASDARRRARCGRTA